MEYLFYTTATMKRHNEKHYWIDRDIVPTIRLSAENTLAALRKYAKIVNEKTTVVISESAIKSRSGLYIDDEDGKPKQIGNVLTGRYDYFSVMEKGHEKMKTQYVDLWVEILQIRHPDDLEDHNMHSYGKGKM